MTIVVAVMIYEVQVCSTIVAYYVDWVKCPFFPLIWRQVNTAVVYK